MELLEKRILEDGKVLSGDVIKVDSFLNQSIDTKLTDELASEWARLFEGEGITKVLTIEASGIAIAAITALKLGVPMVYAKKRKSAPSSDNTYSTKVVSYTHGISYNVTVDKPLISASDKVLIVDDFLANGSALRALISIAEVAGAKVVGCGIAIEKAFLRGGDNIRKRGYRIESLAKIKSVSADGKIEFC